MKSAGFGMTNVFLMLAKRMARNDKVVRVDRPGDDILRQAQDRPYGYMTDLGKLLVIVGGVMVLAGAGLILLGRTGIPLGKLPGDMVYRGKNTTVYFPLATSIVLSVVSFLASAARSGGLGSSI
jgi:hypothetical protein